MSQMTHVIRRFYLKLYIFKTGSSAVHSKMLLVKIVSKKLSTLMAAYYGTYRLSSAFLYHFL